MILSSYNEGITQLVECDTFNIDVIGSNPIIFN